MSNDQCCFRTGCVLRGGWVKTTMSLTSGKTCPSLHPFCVRCLAISQNLGQVMCGLLGRCCQNIPFSYIPLQKSHCEFCVHCGRYTSVWWLLKCLCMFEGVNNGGRKERQLVIFSSRESKWGQCTTLFLLEGILLSLGDFPTCRLVVSQPLRCTLTTLLSDAISLQISYTKPAL